MSDSGQSSSVRFGSLDYIQDTLPSSQATRLKSMVGGLRDSSVVSVLVKSPTEEARHSSSPDSSILLRCCTSCIENKQNGCSLLQHVTAVICCMSDKSVPSKSGRVPTVAHVEDDSCQLLELP